MLHGDLTEAIIGGAFRVHSALGPGFLESVYSKALTVELRTNPLLVELDHRLEVHYRDVVVGEFVADMLIENRIIVEIKAIRTLARPHEIQLVNYLSATGMDVGLLLNFGSPRLEVRRKSRLYYPRDSP